MNAHEQFAGELTRYALGEMSVLERAEVDRHLATCGECRSELQSVRDELSLVALSAADARPPERSRKRLLAAIAREPRLGTTLRPALVTVRRPHAWLGWAAAACALLLGVSSLVLWRQKRALEEQVSQLASGVAQTQLDANNTRDLLAALTSRDTKHVLLEAADAKPQPRGRALYMPHDGKVVFLAFNLGPLPPRKTYQLWLVPLRGGKPISAGTFKPDHHGRALVMRSTAPSLEPKRFAVTIEPEEGTATPTMPMVMVGEGT